LKVAFIGDIVGKPGRLIIKKNLNALKKEYGIDFVIANCENASHGFGITKKNADELYSYGIDFLTGGNHSFDRKEILEFMDALAIIRPLNYPVQSPGCGYKVVEVANKKLAIVNLMGHMSMPLCDNPFTTIEAMLPTIKDECDYVLIDFHAEATAEKQAMFHLLKGRVDAIIGTHTHVSTDDMVIENGCFYISDVGLSGCRDNVLGMQSDIAIKRFLNGFSKHFDIPDSCKTILHLVVLDFANGCENAIKIKLYDNGKKIVQEAIKE
jgi:hypothetical protein